MRIMASKISLVFIMLHLSACASSNVKPEGRDNQFLNNGYSALYQAVSGLRFSDELLLFKFESDRVAGVVKELAATSDVITDDLARLSKSYPALTLDNESLPMIEAKRRKAYMADRTISMSPVVGRSGAGFERTLLLTCSGAVDQTRYLCQVMAKREPNPELNRVLLDCEQQFAELYDEIMRVLNEDYFATIATTQPMICPS